MSGRESCAMVAPSTNSTMLCTIDCGWTTTSIWSKPTPNSSCASMTSRPLFISVDESMVIFGPIDQVGWRSASAMVTVASCSLRVAPERSAAGGDDQTPNLARFRPAGTGRARSARCRPGRSRRSRVHGPRPRPDRRRSGSPCWRAPAACRASSAAMVAGSPAKPTTALSTTSASGSAASSDEHVGIIGTEARAIERNVELRQPARRAARRCAPPRAPPRRSRRGGGG